MTLNDIKATLIKLDDEFACKIMDAQSRAESEPGFTSHLKNGAGEPICAPEDAAPFMDSGRTHLQDAFDDICEAIKYKEDTP